MLARERQIALRELAVRRQECQAPVTLAVQNQTRDGIIEYSIDIHIMILRAGRSDIYKYIIRKQCEKRIRVISNDISFRMIHISPKSADNTFSKFNIHTDIAVKVNGRTRRGHRHEERNL